MIRRSQSASGGPANRALVHFPGSRAAVGQDELLERFSGRELSTKDQRELSLFAEDFARLVMSEYIADPDQAKYDVPEASTRKQTTTEKENQKAGSKY